MNNKALGLAAVAALAIGSGAFYWWRTHHEPTSFTILANKSSADLASPAGENNENSPTQAPHTGIATSGSRVLTPRQRFEQSRDLFAFVQDMTGAAKNNNPEAQAMIADAKSECLSVGMPPSAAHPGAYNVSIASPELKPYIDHLLSVDRQRCGRFTKQDVGNLQSVISAYSVAAKNGSVEALAWQLTYSDLDKIPDATIAADVKAIIASGNPDAIAVLSMSMGERANNLHSVFGSQSGTDVDQWAWLLAACQMGMDCGSEGSLIRGYCINGGQCGFSSMQQMISEKFLSPQSYQKAIAESTLIVSNWSH